MTAAARQGDGTGRRFLPAWRWQTWALAAVCALAAVLYAWRITSEGWGNPYYAAAVKSMSQSLTNFVFGSFDPVGVVTVDKPPLALWAMVLSTAIFGFHSWSVLLPQALEGVAAVFLLHRTVRRWAGENAALIAALALALTPITVAIDRDSNPDTMMVLVLVAAAYAFTRSIEREATSTRWLMLAAFFLGLGFVAKMLQAWIVVPAFVVAYLVGSTAPWGRRVLRVLGAGAVMLVSSMWWVVLIGVWPGPKPYIGGSTDGSVLNLVIGYNGLGRVLGQQAGGAVVGGQARFTGGAGKGGAAGITRMFDAQVAGQISWLLPLCLLVLTVVVVLGVRQIRAGQPAGPRRRAGWFLWGTWMLTVGGVLSFMQNQFHLYYTTEMAPALAALTGAGLPLLWKHYRRSDGYAWVLLPTAVVITAGWAWAVISRDLAWFGWLRYAVALVVVVVVVMLIAGRLGHTGAGLPRVAAMLAVFAVLLAPGVWSAATVFASTGVGQPQAGPGGSSIGRSGPTVTAAHGSPVGRSARQDVGSTMHAKRKPGTARDVLTAEQSRILSYAQANSGDARITLGIEGGATAVEPYVLNTDAAVVGMGGFSGADPVPTVGQLAQWVDSGQLRFVLFANGDHSGRTAQQQSPAAQRKLWVQQHCTAVHPSAYGGRAAARQRSGQVLYDCKAR
jgi:4-amino-4-deoxy-L-arabinose transferase-like glycosyltransferase